MGKAFAKKGENMAGNGKIQFRVTGNVTNTKSFHKVEVPGGGLGESVRWKQVLYLPGQKKGKSLRKFKKATITVVLE